MPRLTSSALTTVFATCALTTAAAAGDPPNAGSHQFRYMAYEVETTSGANAVYRRMKKSAATVCEVGRTSVARRRMQLECSSKLVSDWVKDSGDARLTALHRGDAS
ncbi:MAG: UrcA family protein [Pseudomonadota bacterium]